MLSSRRRGLDEVDRRSRVVQTAPRQLHGVQVRQLSRRHRRQFPPAHYSCAMSRSLYQSGQTPHRCCPLANKVNNIDRGQVWAYLNMTPQIVSLPTGHPTQYTVRRVHSTPPNGTSIGSSVRPFCRAHGRILCYQTRQPEFKNNKSG